MSTPASASGRKILIKLGDGASPEVFAAVLGLTTKSIEIQTASGSAPVLDGSAPETAAAALLRTPGAVSMKVTGSGILATADFTKWESFALGGAAKNCQIMVDDAAAGSFAGPFILSALRMTGVYDQVITADITLDSAATPSYTAAG
jgi:predicted secreted protein